MSIIRVGDVLHGFCSGYFGRDSYGDKVVLAVGRDWVVARDMDNEDVRLANGSEEIHRALAEYLEPERYGFSEVGRIPCDPGLPCGHEPGECDRDLGVRQIDEAWREQD